MGTEQADLPAIGTRAPALEIETLDGQRVTLAGLQGDPGVAVNKAALVARLRELPLASSVGKGGDEVSSR